MNNQGNANIGGNENNENLNHDIPQHLLEHIPWPRDVSFRMTDRQLELVYITWAAARMHVRQQVYRPDLPFAPNPLPPVWPEELCVKMVLWIAREHRMFEMEGSEVRISADRLRMDEEERRNWEGPVGAEEVDGASVDSGIGVVEIKVQLRSLSIESADDARNNVDGAEAGSLTGLRQAMLSWTASMRP
ncbi:uncharacterized protein F5147DRAFT_773233 [Suillus discolor]|uniref:Uncharacterized protein n=1 Tax=Suillus discolor TaxID=1912936 RepID=A0A9P7JUE9_9AGAM|nr:uncharacterized protein F5147DRAFT_773233 [Suillus discolor]KAG2108899.1 hypothetical protein F5147DRAFT_773233 [Suillus discolor]